MTIPNNAALVDNDFICHIASSNKLKTDEIFSALKATLDEWNTVAIIHTLVKNNELNISAFATARETVDAFFTKKIITEILFSDIFGGDSEKEMYYKFLIREYFTVLNNGEIMKMNNGEDELTYWRSKESLGEIHSLTTCMICDCSIFLSDDSDSKKLADYINMKSLKKIDVLNREELFNDEKMHRLLNRPIRKTLTHNAN